MKKKRNPAAASVMILVVLIYISSVFADDTDSSRLETSCNNEYGTCVGEVQQSVNGSAGSVDCTCSNDSGIQADIESAPNDLVDQEELDSICVSTLDKCSESSSDTSSDEDSQSSSDASTNEDNQSNSGNCSIVGIGKSKSTVLFLWLRLLSTGV